MSQFDASSHHVCSGDSVELTWKVTGSGSMKSTPAVQGLPDGPVADQGSAKITPATTTYVHLNVTRFLGSPTGSVQEIHVHQDPQTPETLEVSLADPSAGCANGKVWATVHAQRFSNGIKVASVSARPNDQRTYDVTHASVSGTVKPGDASAQWKGVPIVGDWVLSSPLLPGESCGPSLPHNLGIVVMTECDLGGSQ